MANLLRVAAAWSGVTSAREEGFCGTLLHNPTNVELPRVKITKQTS